MKEFIRSETLKEIKSSEQFQETDKPHALSKMEICNTPFSDRTSLFAKAFESFGLIKEIKDVKSFDAGDGEKNEDYSKYLERQDDGKYIDKETGKVYDTIESWIKDLTTLAKRYEGTANYYKRKADKEWAKFKNAEENGLSDEEKWAAFQKAQEYYKKVNDCKQKANEIWRKLGVETQESQEKKDSYEKENNETEKNGLTDAEKEKIKEETGWSDEIIDAIGSMEEAEIYIKAGLQEAEIDGKKCLIRGDIDWNQKDEMGRTNKERAALGLAPITKNGETIELHHIGQHPDSPLAELTTDEHRGKENDSILHDKTKDSEIDRQVFASERSRHWKERAKEGGNS